MTHKNSKKAYASSRKALSERALLVYDYLRRRRKKGTDKTIAFALGFDHKSFVQPRISELVISGLIREVGAEKDPDTGKTVRVVGI